MSLSTILLFSLPLQQPVAIFLSVLIMILITPVLLRRLKIPHIVGMIVAGIAVGPHGFNLLARDASFEIFGQVGILYLMFLAGVEIDMLNLRKNLRQGISFGLLSFLLPLAGGLLVSRYALHTDWLTGALIATMLSSHTLISYPIAARFGLTNTRASVIAVCGTIVAVLLSLIVLAEVVVIKVDGEMEFVRIIFLFLSMAVYALVLGYALPFATRWFFRNFSDRVTQFIFILAEVLLSSLIAQLIGLEAILGAFYAGLVLNRFVPSRSGLMTRIEFVGNAIFIPYFLIGVGMLMDVSVIFKGWNVAYIALIISVTAISTKWIAAFISQRMFRLSTPDRQLLFGLSSGKAAATIAAVMIGFKYGLLSDDIMNGAVIMILVCCAVASVVTEQAAKRLRMNIAEEELQNDKSSDYTRSARPLIAVANPMTAEGLMRMAVLMRNPANKQPLTALFIRTNDDPRSAANGRIALDDAVKSAVSADVKVDDIERFDANIVAGLTNVMKERRCTEILMGIHRKSNIVDSFFGSTTEQLLQTTNKMIIMSRCFIPPATLQNIFVAVPANAEFETGFQKWVGHVSNLAAQLSCKITFMAYPDTVKYIQGTITRHGYELRIGYRPIDSWDDFIALSGEIEEDDLLIMIGARKTSLSYTSGVESFPAYLSRYFSHHNIMIIYPEQFGDEAELPAPIDPLSATIASAPGGWNWRRLFSGTL